MPGGAKQPGGRSVELKNLNRAVRAGVRCPSCRSEAKQTEFRHKAGNPRWHCMKPTCDFYFGWILDFEVKTPTTATATKLPRNDDMIAVPVDIRLRPLPDKAVPWPHPDALPASMRASSETTADG